MTNESIAIALGWTRKRGRTIAGRTSYYWTFPGAGRGRSQKQPPAFTTDFEAIFAEVVARKLVWATGANYHGMKGETVWASVGDASDSGYGTTPAHAICAALMTYLKRRGSAKTALAMVPMAPCPACATMKLDGPCPIHQ